MKGERGREDVQMFPRQTKRTETGLGCGAGVESLIVPVVVCACRETECWRSLGEIL